MTEFEITPVRDAAGAAAVAALLRAYAAALPVDLGFQGFEAEVAGLPGAYAPPSGELLLARSRTGVALGCVGLRASGAGVCEIKRLYVAPSGRGTGLGRALAEACIAAAARAGYREVRLDTLASMDAAQALYRRLGFTPTAPYYVSPVPGTVFLRRQLP